MNEVDVTNLVCPSCAAPLVVPPNCNGRVFCSSCGAQCVITGLELNSEITKKSNINSGVPLSADAGDLNISLVNSIKTSQCLPVNFFRMSRVVLWSRMMIPVYLFHCNAMASYSFDNGVQRTRQVAYTISGNTHFRNENYTEWTRNSEVASVSDYIVASGNKKYKNVISNLYGDLKVSNLVDVERLQFPADCKTLEFNVPSAAAFSENAENKMRSLAMAAAQRNLSGNNYRNLNINSCSTQKDEEIRILVGINHVVYEYNAKRYEVYFSADGSKSCVIDNPPVDYSRISAYKMIDERRKNVKDDHNGFNALGVLSIVGAFFSASLLTSTEVSTNIFGLVLIAAFVFGAVKAFKKAKSEKEAGNKARAEIDRDLRALNQEAEVAVTEFTRDGGMLRGWDIVSANKS